MPLYANSTVLPNSLPVLLNQILQGQQADNKAEVQTSPIPTAAESPQTIPSLLGMNPTSLQNATSYAATRNPDIYLNTEELQQPGGHPFLGSAEERFPSSSLATLYSARNTDYKECHNTEEVCAYTVVVEWQHHWFELKLYWRSEFY